MGDHSSRTTLARRLKQPTRAASGNTPILPPLFGLAPGGVCRAACRYRRRGALLPHPFTVASPKRSPSALCGTVPGVASAGRYPAPLFRGARTFLGALARDAAARPSGVSCRSALWRAGEAAPARSPTPPPRHDADGRRGGGAGRCRDDQSSPCGLGSSNARRIMRHSPSTSPSISSGRKRRWNAMIAAIGSDTS